MELNSFFIIWNANVLLKGTKHYAYTMHPFYAKRFQPELLIFQDILLIIRIE